MEKTVKSPGVISESRSEGSNLMKQESMNSRFARCIDRVRNLEAENRERCLNEAEDRLNEQHEIHNQRIQELREKYEAQMKINREEIESVYETKINTVQNAAKQNKDVLADVLDQLKVARDRLDKSNGQAEILLQVNFSLHSRISDLQAALDSEISRSAKNQMEIDRLREEMAQLLEEHHQLLDAKSSLALEISLYEELLSNAEKHSPQSSSSIVKSGRKRKAIDASQVNL